MNKSKLLLLLLPLLVVGCTPKASGGNNYNEGGNGNGGNSGGDATVSTKEFAFEDLGYADTTSLTSASGYGITFAFAKGTGSIDPKYYESGTSARLYAGNTLTISGTSITKVEFTFETTKTGEFTCDKSTYTNTNAKGTWQGDATNSLVFTVSNGQRRVVSAKVTAALTDDAGDFAGGSSGGDEDYTPGWPSASDIEAVYGVSITVPVLEGYENKAEWCYYPEDDWDYQSFEIWLENENIESQYIELLTNDTNNYTLVQKTFEFEGEVYVFGEYYVDPTETLAVTVDYLSVAEGDDYTGTVMQVYLASEALEDIGGGTDEEVFQDGWPTASDVQTSLGVSTTIPSLSGYENKAKWSYYEETDDSYQMIVILIEEENIAQSYIESLTTFTKKTLSEEYEGQTYTYDFYCDSANTIAILVDYYSSEDDAGFVGTYIGVYLYSDLFTA